jgi:hypothetical protein
MEAKNELRFAGIKEISPSTLERRCKFTSSSLRASLERMEHIVSMLQTGLPVSESLLENYFEAVLRDIPPVLADMASMAYLLEVDYSVNPDFTAKFESEIQILEGFSKYDQESRKYYVP